MTNKHSEQTLQELYQARKHSHQAPNELKDDIMRTARQQKTSPWRWFTVPSAIAFCCLVVILGHWSRPDPQQPAPTFQVSQTLNEDNQSVYFIEVALRQDERPTKQTMAKLDTAQQKYQSALAQLKQGQQLRGTIREIGDGLEIQLCQLGVVQISEQIVQQLREQGLLKRLEPGQEVLLLANQEGRIFSIEQVPSGPKCELLG